MEFLVGGLVGVILGALVIFVIMRVQLSRAQRQLATSELPPTALPPIVAQIINGLRSAGIIVGPHDEVLESSAQARALGIVRGSRVVQPELLELIRDGRASKQIRTLDLEIARDSISKVHLSSRVAPLAGGLVLILTEDQTAAQRVEDTRRDFVANVSHELKTPIGAVTLLSEAVEGAADDPEAVRRFANRLRKESLRLSELVRQVIDLSRLQAADPQQKHDVVEVTEVLSLAVDRCRLDAERRNINLTLAPSGRFQVTGDAPQLVEALVNLVGNAIVYSDDGAKVVASARRTTKDDESWIEMSVSDNGIGIAPAETERIFERFYRVDYSRSRANGGTGLGLSIVKHIAAAHGGDISVWSQLGHGSTFTIRIPEHDASEVDGQTDYDQG